MAYTEWKPGNEDVRPLLLYYLQLVVDATGQPYFFSKGNVTSARKILNWADKYKFNPYFYVYLNFITKPNDLKRGGFQFMAAGHYLSNFVNLVEKKTHRQYNVPKPMYDIIKNDLLNTHLDTFVNKPEEIANLIFTNKIDFYSFLYVITIFDIKNILNPEAVKHKLGRLFVLLDRCVIPSDFSQFSFANYEEYCIGTNGPEPTKKEADSNP